MGSAGFDLGQGSGVVGQRDGLASEAFYLADGDTRPMAGCVGRQGTLANETTDGAGGPAGQGAGYIWAHRGWVEVTKFMPLSYALLTELSIQSGTVLRWERHCTPAAAASPWRISAPAGSGRVEWNRVSPRPSGPVLTVN